MRLLHSADWHLGRIFHGTSLLEDQSHLVEQFVELAREAAVDAVLLAGDVYDRAIPPAEAVALFDDFLARMALDLDVPVVGIAGNHDSAERLGFASRLLSASRIHLAGRLEGVGEPVVLEDATGPVHVYSLPYADPPMVRAHLLSKREREADVSAIAELRSHDACMRAQTGQLRARSAAGVRSVLVAHAFVAGGEECESERPLSVGGSGAVAKSAFDGFDYVALGHLHRPQQLGDCIRYSGSLAKYSFSELEHRKSVSVVEMDAEGSCSIEEGPLTPRRELRCIEGRLAELLEGPGPGERRDDYLLVRLLDEGALLAPMNRLREVYPNVMQLERPALGGPSSSGHSTAQRGKSEAELFSDFFREVTGAAMSATERAAYAAVLDRDAGAAREQLTLIADGAPPEGEGA